MLINMLIHGEGDAVPPKYTVAEKRWEEDVDKLRKKIFKNKNEFQVPNQRDFGVNHNRSFTAQFELTRNIYCTLYLKGSGE